MKLTRSLVAFVLTVLASPALAAPPPASVPERPGPPGFIPPKPLVIPGNPDRPDPAALDEFMAKLFPPLPDPDPGRLALSRQSAALMWPDGSYGQTMTGLMDMMFANVMKLRPSDLGALAADAKIKAAISAKNQSLHDAATAKDPNFDKRMAAIQDVIHDQMRQVSAVVDPRMREGLARTMARRFDAAQLRDINAFFATPAGRAFGAQSMQMWMDPETFRAMTSSLPAMLKLIPAMSRRFEAETSNLPKPPGAVARAKH